ncbi:hypothetical protein GCM10023196_015390 [Actinoallomurus vinaceus]|uniref:DUF4432 domain-containing protein n=1 Tax=Actinoallomurus vinaceus TaxID=1080074 RepID=A0ABP8U4I5_9ACTN
MYRRNWGCRVHEITLAGLRAIVLENELLRVTVLADKGGDVVEFCHKPRDLDFAWLAPAGLRDPRDVAGGAADDAALFHDQYEGGWQEVFPNGGAPSTYRGAALAQHGEVAGLPWDAVIVEDDPGEVAVRLTVRTRRLPFRLAKTFRLISGEPTLMIEEELHNESGVDLDAMWGHHIVFGAPFLRPGARIRMPEGVRVIPHETAINPPERRVGEPGPWPAPDGTTDLSVVPEPGAPSDIVYLTGFTDGWYEVADALRVEWDATVLPYVWMWQELGAWRDYPWWGRAYVVGLEPFSSFPTNGLAEAARNGSALRVPAGAARSLWLRATVLEE